jgi:hypothetical protein|tara:strand:- start:2299 stop:2583 length:285 start_codon:yes stop_codon:yes gene_type:complete
MSAIGLVKRGVNLNTIANTNQVFSNMVSLSVTAYGGDVTVESGTLVGATFTALSTMTLKEGLSINVNATNGSVLGAMKITSGSATISAYVITMF